MEELDAHIKKSQDRNLQSYPEASKRAEESAKAVSENTVCGDVIPETKPSDGRFYSHLSCGTLKAVGELVHAYNKSDISQHSLHDLNL